MSLLSERDYLGVLDAVRRLNSEPDPERVPAVALDVVQRLVRGQTATFNEVNPQAERINCFWDTPDLATATAGFIPIFERHLMEHPLIRRAEAMRFQRRVMGVSKISDFQHSRRFRKTGLYQDCYRHLDTNFQMVVTIAADETKIVALAVNRKLRDFSERDRRVLHLLEPHLRTAYEAAMRRLKLRKLYADTADAQVVEDLQSLGLTRREAEALFYIVQGKSSKQIAECLSASPRTIQKHIEHLFTKLNVKNRPAAVMRVIAHLERANARGTDD